MLDAFYTIFGFSKIKKSNYIFTTNILSFEKDEFVTINVNPTKNCNKIVYFSTLVVRKKTCTQSTSCVDSFECSYKRKDLFRRVV